jgi:hypothetical protein
VGSFRHSVDKGRCARTVEYAECLEVSLDEGWLLREVEEEIPLAQEGQRV